MVPIGHTTGSHRAYLKLKISHRADEYMKRFPSVKNLKITESDLPEKKLKAEFELDGERKVVHFGQKNSVTWLEYALSLRQIKRRSYYQSRASAIRNSKGERTYLLPGTANSLSYWILW